MHETPQSLADFVAYATDPADTSWGSKRVADGHPEPYRLKNLQLGNEERIDRDFAERFKARATAIWQVAPELQLIVGDFMYNDAIRDASRVTGAASGIENLDGQRSILEFARQSGHEVWFDVHVWTDGPGRHPSLPGALSFIDALEKLETGADFKVVIFEFNANNHQQRRALGNALAINAVERDGRVPIALSANCLQPDGQNDNGWDQGLLFLSPSQAWLQPPGYVTQMYAQQYRPRLVETTVRGAELDGNAKLSEDGKSLVCIVVNPGDESVATTVEVRGFSPSDDVAQITELAAPLEAVNTAASPNAVIPHVRDWRYDSLDGRAELSLAPHSVTTIVFD
jgi:alpha-L-arabinofuranosidase